VSSIGYDPNLKEFSGSKAFPWPFWQPLDVCRNRELLEQIGVVRPEDETVPDSLTDAAYFAVWSSFQFIGSSQRREVASRIVSEQDLSAEVTQEGVRETYR
jgi:hypothetical protein